LIIRRFFRRGLVLAVLDKETLVKQAVVVLGLFHDMFAAWYDTIRYDALY